MIKINAVTAECTQKQGRRGKEGREGKWEGTLREWKEKKQEGCGKISRARAISESSQLVNGEVEGAEGTA